MREDLDCPLNLTNRALVGSPSPNLAVQMHMRLKFECSIVFGVLRVDVDEVPKDTIELTTGTLRERGTKRPLKPQNLCTLVADIPKPKTDHILGDVAQNVISSAPNPPATTHFW